jgi:NAD(P)-dependent dehydrogenase (short-subunit alcohol dehydrogenase family)
MRPANPTQPEVPGAGSPFASLSQPEDIANAVVFLCSEQGRYVTNQRITVSGGGF